ncbi:hypothetical protein FK529_04870 [Tsukamurella asaccharolytica]|uniref:Uncharacterized protein n=1 Tax=Tsukamurella asaccharolytica TaxID=2592067 RepID=A0A5C5RCV8_9ACTN|nr:hypothetical protein [Tsukamurella asaccharolytica]TWS20676.1 hypothetical protein FK529_04870 [Tsukamurella asaccharolytica]
MGEVIFRLLVRESCARIFSGTLGESALGKNRHAIVIHLTFQEGVLDRLGKFPLVLRRLISVPVDPISF